MFLVAGGLISSYVAVVPQAVAAATSQALRRYMRPGFSLYRRCACEVDASSTSHACRR